jgi:Fic family protein
MNKLKLEYLYDVYTFSEESNRIEGIYDNNAHKKMASMVEMFLCKDDITVDDVISFANNIGGELRDKKGMNVRVGSHIPPAGNQNMKDMLCKIIKSINENTDHPFTCHHRFETLHPFTDGNGRTGRALWLWQMIEYYRYNFQISFLHSFYYQSLSMGRQNDE